MESNKGTFRKVDGKVAYLHPTCSADGWGPGIILATPITEQQYMSLGTARKEIVEVEDGELLRLWPHRTKRANLGDNTTEDKLKDELENRGYALGADQKWIKSAKKVTLNDLRRKSTSLIGTGNYCALCGGLCGNSNHNERRW